MPNWEDKGRVNNMNLSAIAEMRSWRPNFHRNETKVSSDQIDRTQEQNKNANRPSATMKMPENTASENAAEVSSQTNTSQKK